MHYYIAFNLLKNENKWLKKYYSKFSDSNNTVFKIILDLDLQSQC